MVQQIAKPVSKPITDNAVIIADTLPPVQTQIASAQPPAPQRKMFDQILISQAYADEPQRKPVIATNPIFVQTGAFSNEDNAMTMKMALYNIAEPVKIINGEDNMYRVKIGPFTSQSDADAVLGSLTTQGRDAKIVMK
jgi:cell division protein FtsN